MCVCVNCFGAVLFVLYKSFLRCCCWFWCTAKPSWCYPVPALVSTRMSRSKTCFWKLSSRELKTRKRRWRKRKTKNKFTNIFTGNLRQNKISWTTTQQQQKQQQCNKTNKKNVIVFFLLCFLQILLRAFRGSALIT